MVHFFIFTILAVLMIVSFSLSLIGQAYKSEPLLLTHCSLRWDMLSQKVIKRDETLHGKIVYQTITFQKLAIQLLESRLELKVQVN